LQFNSTKIEESSNWEWSLLNFDCWKCSKTYILHKLVQSFFAFNYFYVLKRKLILGTVGDFAKK